MKALPINSHCSVCNLVNNCITNGLPERCYINQLLEKIMKMQRVVENAKFLLRINQNGCMSQIGESELAQALAELEGGLTCSIGS